MVKQRYLLDSDILITILRDKLDRTGLRSKALQVGLENCYVSSISLSELYGGAYRMQSDKGLHEVEFVKTIFNIVPFGSTGGNEAEIFGRDKAVLSKSGLPLADMDLQIGATAKARKMIMVTHNVRHFSRIPGLTVEDWLSIK